MFKSIEEHAKLLGRSRQLANCRRQSTLYMCTANTVIYWLHVQVVLQVENSICDISVFFYSFMCTCGSKMISKVERHTHPSTTIFLPLVTSSIYMFLKFCRPLNFATAS